MTTFPLSERRIDKFHPENGPGIEFSGALLKLTGLCFALFVLVQPATLHAQVAGTMSGYVKDASDAIVPKAKVTATLVDRGTIFIAETNVEGYYNFPALQPGTYTVAVEKSGFSRSVQSGLILTVRQNLRVDATLHVGAVTQAVSVTGQAPLVDTASGTISGLVDDRRIVDLPLNGRNIMSLSATVPGVLNISAPESMSCSECGPTMNVNGGRANHNLYTFDGAYFVNPAQNTGLNYPPPDAIQEFRMQTANFDAEYGHNSGAQTAVVSKAGTNKLHGDLWEFLRNDAFNARSFFASTVPADKENQFGGTVGGPIKKDKLFYFGGFQGLHKRTAGVSNEATVPTPAERTGDFTALLPGTVLVDPTSPLTGAPLTTPTGVPCVSDNIIAPSCLNPVSKDVLQYIPVTPTGTLVTLVPQPLNDYMYFGRVDVNISPNNVLFGHVYVDHNTNSDISDFSSVTTYTHFRSGEETDMMTLNETYTIKPTLVNQAVASFLRATTVQLSYPQITNASLGINLAQYSAHGAPAYSIGGSLTLGDPGSAASIVQFIANQYQFRDAMTWIKGRHTFKFGGEVLPLHFLQRATGNPVFNFTGSRSGDPFADFMLGAYTSLGMNFGETENDNLTVMPSVFFQDEFKVKPHLTVTYGLRWEPNLFWYNKFNHLTTFKAGAQSTVVPDAPPGIVFPGDPGIPRTIVPPDLNNLAPRLGFAWDVFGNGKMSVRGGYGVFFEQLNADTLSQQNAPFTGIASAFNGLISDPFGSVGQTPPPVVPSGKFGCVKISTPPGVNCPLFPLPMLGYFIDLTLQTPYWQGWNLDIQRQVTPNTMVEVSYIGKDGIKLNNIWDFSAARFIPGTSYDPATGVETAVSSLENVNSRVVYEPGILTPYSWMLGNDYRSWYHSFQVQLIRRLSNGLSVNASYTLAKSIDMCSAICEAGASDANPFNLRAQRGRADWDRRHALVASYLWSPSIRFSDRWKDVLLDGWTFSGITTLQSGAPMSFYSGVDVGVNGSLASEHAFLTGQPIARSHSSRAAMVGQFFNTSAFVSPICTFTPQPFNAQVIEQENCTPDGIPYNLLGQYGESGRNILSGPAFSNTDFSVMKTFQITERYKAEFRAEFFNIFNEVNFNKPDNTVTDSTFGQILGANPGRVIQFGLKFFW